MKKGFVIGFISLFTGLAGYSQTDSLTAQQVDSVSVTEEVITQVDTGAMQVDAGSINITRTTEGKDVNEPVYKLKPAIDIPLTVVAAGWSIYGFQQIYNKEKSSEDQIRALDPNDINGFDRWAADVYSEKAADVSDLIFYGSMPLPLVLIAADKEIRKDAAKVGFMYLETMSVLGVFYTGTPYLVDRYRPLAYNPNVDMTIRTGGGAKNSFFAGHVALVATTTFFTAKVFNDYHPDSKLRGWLFGGAAVATAATGYLRHKGGRHFPSDILVGTAVGTLAGILMPHFHKNKVYKNTGLSITPYSTGRTHGLAMRYRL